MQLKKYQQSALDTLRVYLQTLQQVGSAKRSFIEVTGEPYNDKFFGEIPFVCVKIPTGGGKTLVATESVAAIYRLVMQSKMDKGIVLWFVPSEAIKTQTLNKFKDKKDWHRKVLDDSFENNVRIFSNEEALRIRKEDIEDNLCIIVSSLEAFRKDKKLQSKYKVYQENGSLLDHFQNISDDSSLEKDEEGTVIYSLANLIRMNNPLVVIDEGHRTQTQLSVDFLKDLNPSFIVEYTATPRSGSNILVNVLAADLKDEQMVKLPIVLESANQWELALARGLEKLDELEKEAKKLKEEYIRPIALIQAQPSSKTVKNVTVDVVKEHLLKLKIKEEEIAIKTSEKNELDGVNLFSKACKIKYIITVNALAEGWDCSFAYVLISLANIGSKISVEQIIGRIIRMPYAERKAKEDLNRSYVFASARNFNEAATQIISGLETNGYSRADLINGESKEQKDPSVIDRIIKKDFAVPMMSFGVGPLYFESLIGEDFELAKQKADFDLDIHYDSDGRAIIDIEQDHWIKGRQQMLRLTYRDKNFSKRELAVWLDKKLRFTILSQQDKLKFVEKVINHQLKTKSLVDLSINRWVLLSKLSNEIVSILEQYAQKNFDKSIKTKKISTKPFEAFPHTITVDQVIPQEFNKNYYEKIDKLNKEELNFIERLDLDTLPNVNFWVRNREKKDPFYLQGWKRNKFYPDFVVSTKKGNIIAIEWKGGDRVSNEDTQYKVELGDTWASLGKGKLHFFLAHNGNAEEVLKEIKDL
jgi:superfamily II DNA or RNA helicase